MHVRIWSDDDAPTAWRWCAANHEYDLGVQVGRGASPSEAIADLLWAINDETTDPAQCELQEIR